MLLVQYKTNDCFKICTIITQNLLNFCVTALIAISIIIEPLKRRLFIYGVVKDSLKNPHLE
jgi:hypothetical protein